MIETKQIKIKPVTKSKFSGISFHSKTSTVINGAQLDKSGLYKTGLTQEEEKFYEEQLNLPKGNLNKRNEKFWGTLDIRLFNDKPTYFTIASPLDELKYKVILEHNFIANNELELVKNPMAQFYIEDIEAKAKLQEKGIKRKFEAMKILMDLTIEEKRGFLKLYGVRGVDNVSETVVNANLYGEVEKDPDRFIDYAQDPDLKIKIMIENLLEQGMLKKKGAYYTYENETIGSSLDAAVEFFKDPKNQSVKIVMEQEAKNRKRGRPKSE